MTEVLKSYILGIVPITKKGIQLNTTAQRRGSRQKKAVLDAVLQTCSHPTAEEVFLLVRQLLPGTSLSTVYRNLGILVSEGKIIAVSGPGHQVHYDHKTHDHCHAQCLCCGKVCDLEHSPVDFRALVPADAAGFAVDGVSVTFTGLCSRCTEERKENHEP